MVTLLVLLLAAVAAESHPVVRAMPGSTLTGGAIEDDGEMVLSFRGEDGRTRETVRGRRYSLEYDAPGEAREAIVDFFESESKELDSGVVLRRAGNRLTFRFRRPEGGTSWCELWATDGRYALEIVDEPPAPETAAPEKPERKEAPIEPAPDATEVLGTLHFARGSADLAPGAGAVLDAVAERALTAPSRRLAIRGYREPEEPAELADARARAVAEALELYGIPADRLDVGAEPSETGARVDVRRLP